tara:strand:+ start:4090 stop:4278 length:189 start_codon:yes stop_codon:yes gene_type:complete
MELLKALWNVVTSIANVFVVLCKYIKSFFTKKVEPIVEAPAPTPTVTVSVTNEHGATTTVAQ